MRILLVVLGLASLVYAADQTILGKQLQVKDPRPGVTAAKRKVVGQAKEASSADTIVGNPSVGGATLTVFANGTTSSIQGFTLHQGADPVTGKPFWAAAGSSGYTYKDKTGANGAVKLAQIKKSSGGTFQIKAVIVGKNGPVNVVPPNPGTDGCMVFTISGGDRYHVLFPAAPDGTITKNDSKTFLVKSALVEGDCPGSTSACVATSGTFCNLGNGTIYDSATGLQWEVKTTAVGSGVNAADLHDVDNGYQWAGSCSVTTTKLCQPNLAAETACKAQTPAVFWGNGCEQCVGSEGACTVVPPAITTVWNWVTQVNATNHAGHNDWRVPSEEGRNVPPGTALELESILAGAYPTCGASPCVPPIFGPTVSNGYWSSTTRSAVVADTIGIDFTNAFINPGYTKSFTFWVRAVRTAGAVPTTTTTSSSTTTTTSTTTSTLP